MSSYFALEFVDFLAAAVEADVFHRPERTWEYHFPESAFGLESLHISTSRDDEVLAIPCFINESDRALGYRSFQVKHYNNLAHPFLLT